MWYLDRSLAGSHVYWWAGMEDQDCPWGKQKQRLSEEALMSDSSLGLSWRSWSHYCYKVWSWWKMKISLENYDDENTRFWKLSTVTCRSSSHKSEIEQIERSDSHILLRRTIIALQSKSGLRNCRSEDSSWRLTTSSSPMKTLTT